MDFGPGVSVQVRQSHGCWVLTVAGHADHDEEDKLTSAMRETAAADLPVMVIDLSALTFADTSFIHWLLMARRDHAQAGTRLILAGPLHEHVRRVLTVTGLLDHFTLADDLDAALGHAAP
ncbi:STAS domain-containing protein [Streptomyces sp. NPDC057939]|uniref:STAS domain-containing protein n=1 Tax=Streptomyces sp. NPDC057939 TaxID=3346284 RepID=UPI0036ED4731